MPKSLSSGEYVTNQEIWLAYINFCTSAAAIVAGSAEKITQELILDILTSYDGVEAVASDLDIDEDYARQVIEGMLDPVWAPFYETLVFRLERAHEGSKNPGTARDARLDYIYLMYDEETDLYKIGRSYSPVARLSAINRNLAPGKKPVILAHSFVADNAVEAEKQMHDIFKEQRVEREWFRLEPQHITAIEQTFQFSDGNFMFFDVSEK